MYGVKENSEQRTATFELLKSDQNFSSEPIVQIDVGLVDFDSYYLFSLSQGIIRVHKIGSQGFDFVHSNTETKGASLFALNQYETAENLKVVQICVVVKRQLKFWYFKGGEFLKHSKDIEIRNTFVGQPKHIIWNKTTISVGYVSGYVIYDVGSFLSTKNMYVFCIDIKTFDYLQLYTSGKIEIPNSVISDPCILVIIGLLSIVKDEKLVAVDRKSGELLQENAFEPCSMSRLVRRLGMRFFHNINDNNSRF